MSRISILFTLLFSLLCTSVSIKPMEQAPSKNQKLKRKYTAGLKKLFELAAKNQGSEAYHLTTAFFDEIYALLFLISLLPNQYEPSQDFSVSKSPALGEKLVSDYTRRLRDSYSAEISLNKTYTRYYFILFLLEELKTVEAPQVQEIKEYLQAYKRQMEDYFVVCAPLSKLKVFADPQIHFFSFAWHHARAYKLLLAALAAQTPHVFEHQEDIFKYFDSYKEHDAYNRKLKLECTRFDQLVDSLTEDTLVFVRHFLYKLKSRVDQSLLTRALECSRDLGLAIVENTQATELTQNNSIGISFIGKVLALPKSSDRRTQLFEKALTTGVNPFASFRDYDTLEDQKEHVNIFVKVLQEDDKDIIEAILKQFKNDPRLNDLYFPNVFGAKAPAVHYVLLKSKSWRLFTLLAEYGADINHPDGEGYTLFDRVCALKNMQLKKRRQLANTLIKHGARTSCTTPKQFENFKQELLAPLKKKKRAYWVEKFQTMGIDASLL